jgi:hypothetical protein
MDNPERRQNYSIITRIVTLSLREFGPRDSAAEGGPGKEHWIKE